jgi:hypothetical protein
LSEERLHLDFPQLVTYLSEQLAFPTGLLGSLQELREVVQQRLKLLHLFMQELQVVTDVLHRCVDLVCHTRRKLTYAL